MIQAFTVKSTFSDVRYKATDFDPYVSNEMVSGFLNDIEKGILDGRKLTSRDLFGFDLLVCWEVIYAMPNTIIDQILAACKEAGVTFFAATSQLTGPVHRLISMRHNGYKNGYRVHGWQSSDRQL